MQMAPASIVSAPITCHDRRRNREGEGEGGGGVGVHKCSLSFIALVANSTTYVLVIILCSF